jgi:hypothetical protein
MQRARRYKLFLFGIVVAASNLIACAPSDKTPQGPCWTSPATAMDWPPACWRPYKADSTFNRKISGDPTLLPNSADIVDRLLNDIHGDPNVRKPNNMVANQPTGNTGEPTYYSHSNDPVFTVHCKNDPFGRPDGSCPIENSQIRIPAGAQIEGGAALANSPGADRHLTVLDTSVGLEYDLWQVKTNPLPAAGGPLEISFGGRTQIYGNGLSDPAVLPGQFPGDATAAHVGSLAGRIREEELENKTIDHALFIDINCDSGEIVYPARGHGHPCSALGKPNTNAPPMGARFQLNMTHSEIEALDPAKFPDWKKTILRAAADYGMIFGDTGAQGYFSIETEAGNQYTSVGAGDKWLAFAQTNGWTFYPPDQNYVGDLDGHLKDGTDIWSKLRVIAPILPSNVQVPSTDPTSPTAAMDAFTDAANLSQPIATVTDMAGPLSRTLNGNETVTLIAVGGDGDGGPQDIQIWMSETTYTTGPGGLITKQGPTLQGMPSASSPDTHSAVGDTVRTQRITSFNIVTSQLRAGHSGIQVDVWATALNFAGASTRTKTLTLTWP